MYLCEKKNFLLSNVVNFASSGTDKVFSDFPKERWMIPTKVICREFDLSEAMSDAIDKHIEKLEDYSKDLMHCEIVVTAPHRHHHKGKIYHINIRIHTRNGDIIVNHQPEKNHAHEDFYVSLRDSFRAARRMVEDHARKLRGPAKNGKHGPPPAVVKRIFPGEDYGFLETHDGREIYFHRNSLVKDGFERLEVGMKVTFSEKMGENGPQATSVHIGGKKHKPA
jgi:cold shock CspA family protein/ribosome-associated translation inhibitor RaiA